MNEETLEIEYKVDYREFSEIWFDYFKKGVPTTLAFWGTGILASLLVFYFLENKFYGFLLTMIFLITPVLILIANYQNFVKAAKDNYSTLSEEEKIVHLSFQRNSDGFDSRNGKNFSHIAWESIKGVTELNDFFVFARAGNAFYVPKNAFRDESEIRFLRFLVSVNVKKDVKLLESNQN